MAIRLLYTKSTKWDESVVKNMTNAQAIVAGKTFLGVELGSTRIKAVLLGPDYTPIAGGSHTWENRIEGGYWTYHMEDVWAGIADCYRDLKRDVREKFGITLTTVGAMGISGMMHGYLPFDKDGNQLEAFRTWRNTTTAQAAEELTALFGFNIPQRWSISHLRQAMLNGEQTVKNIDHLTTLAGYVHWQLTGQKVLGVCEASGMFPVNDATGTYDAAMVEKFDKLAENQPWKLLDILPGVLSAGQPAGCLTEAGAKLLDPEGDLMPGIPLCPPEGDGGTGMTATNSVAARTGNVSAGTSIFAMVVLEKMLTNVYPEIDMVTTPSGKPVAMVHCNNCTSDMNAWVGVLAETLKLMGHEVDMGQLFTKLYQKSLEGDADCGGVTVYNYLSGEPVTGFDEGRPVVVRSHDKPFTLANFLRSQLYGTLASLAAGMVILEKEEVAIDRLMGHGGLFKTPVVGQKYLAAATNSPVWVMETAGEGGPYGMALLAAYLKDGDGATLEDFLAQKVFAGTPGTVLEPEEADVAGFKAYLNRFLAGLPVERAAVDHL